MKQTLAKFENTVTRDGIIYEEAPELYHYTNRTGLIGILDTNTLWATRYDLLNDSREIDHLRLQLIQAVTVNVEERLHKLTLIKSDISNAIRREGGPKRFSKKIAPEYVKSIYDTTYNVKVKEKGFAVPFITSFCSHVLDSDYTRKNGLLSQWRAYGGKEAYALVFDTKSLEEFVLEDGASYGNQAVYFANVEYDKGDRPFEVKYASLIRAFGSRIENEICGISDSDSAFIMFNEFARASVRAKHQAFEEEREYRIAALISRPENIESLYAKERLPVPDERHRPTYEKPDGKERLHLFEQLKGRPLPIRKIIVGPHEDQQRLVSELKKIAPSNISISKSDTPIRWQHVEENCKKQPV